MPTGIVKKFHSKKGYGFIRPDGEKDDAFVHFTQIKQDGFRLLNRGDRVEFDVVEVDGKKQAVNVRIYYDL